MNQDWQKEIRHKALMYRETPAWVDRAALERRMAEAYNAGRRRMTVVWSRRLVAAAAVAALAVPLADLLTTGRKAPLAEQPQATAAIAGRAAAPEEASPAGAPQATAAAPAAASPLPQNAMAHITTNGETAAAAAKEEPAQTAPETGNAATTAPTQPQRNEGRGKQPPAAHTAARPRTLPRTVSEPLAGTRRGQAGRLKASAYLANAMQGSNTKEAMAAILPMADPIGDFVNTFSGMESEQQLAQTEPARTEVNHHAPVRFGVTVSLPLSRRWAVESGLVYSYLYSDIASGTPNCSSETDQRLHYVGIPVAATYTVWSNRRFAVYAKAGGMVEKMVSGRADTRTIVDGREESSEREHLSIGSLQLSVNGAVGAEWRFADRLGAYLEPGISYSFDNGSSVPTLYADKPLAFNLAFGLRFGLADRN